MKTILIVDDDEQVRSFLQRLLSPFYEVIVANNGAKALRLLRDHYVDLVITDIYMPEKDGLEVIKEMAFLDPPPAIIAMSGKWYRYGDYCPMAARGLGAEQLLSKPFSCDEVLHTIQAILHMRNEATVSSTE